VVRSGVNITFQTQHSGPLKAVLQIAFTRRKKEGFETLG